MTGCTISREISTTIHCTSPCLPGAQCWRASSLEGLGVMDKLLQGLAAPLHQLALVHELRRLAFLSLYHSVQRWLFGEAPHDARGQPVPASSQGQVKGGESIWAGQASLCLVAGPSQRCARRTGPGSKVGSERGTGGLRAEAAPGLPKRRTRGARGDPQPW